MKDSPLIHPDGTGVEIWHSAMPYADTVTAVRALLPIGGRFQGLPWCAEDVNDVLVTWSWGAAPETPMIAVNVVSPDRISILTTNSDPVGC